MYLSYVFFFLFCHLAGTVKELGDAADKIGGLFASALKLTADVVKAGKQGETGAAAKKLEVPGPALPEKLEGHVGLALKRTGASSSLKMSFAVICLTTLPAMIAVTVMGEVAYLS